MASNAGVIKVGKRRLSRWIWLVGLSIVVLLTIWWLLPGSKTDLPSTIVQSGEFVINLKETGRLRAELSETVSAPPIRMNLQIVDLVPEGEIVEKGDMIIQFDTTEINQRIDDQRAEIDISRSNLTRNLVSMESNLASLRSGVEEARASYRLAQLRLEQMKFEADVKIEEENLRLFQAELSLKRAERNVEAQLQIDSAELRSLELKIHQDEIDLEKTLLEKSKLTVLAPAPGLVVYKETWKGGEMGKIKIGDTPWRGQALIELPDLSIMLVETSVSEVDVAKIKVGLLVEIKLDAYPDPTFHGELIEIAALAKTEEGTSNAKVFDVLVRIEESDPLLKPGMSARANIIIDELQDKLWIPVEAVFNDNGRTIVWESTGGGWKMSEVQLGARNDNHVVVESGVEAGARVALVDPSTAIDEKSGSVEKSDETGNNNNAPMTNAKSRPRRGRHRRR